MPVTTFGVPLPQEATTRESITNVTSFKKDVRMNFTQGDEVSLRRPQPYSSTNVQLEKYVQPQD
jgi:hypothetical protein